MVRTILFLLLLVASVDSSGQSTLNAELLGNLPYAQDGQDIWGWNDSLGNEYAIMGIRRATVIIDATDAANPTEVARIPGSPTIWRDIKSYKNFVYVIGDRIDDGLLVIDMQFAPDSFPHQFLLPTVSIDLGIDTLVQIDTVKNGHNLYVDGDRLYLAGGNVNKGGIVIFDLLSDPANPEIIGYADARYSHDVYVRNDTIYSSDVEDGFLSIMDATRPDSVYTIVTRETARSFTHNAWLSDDGKYVFTTDEKPGAYVESYDVTSLLDIELLDQYRPDSAVEKNTIPHNVHYYNGYLVTSYYTEGLIVLDASRPYDLVRVAQYDTYLPEAGGFRGNWGAYPFTPSGNIFLSDINNGFYAVRVDYQRAPVIDGIVYDSVTGNPVPLAFVDILGPSDSLTLKANVDGTFEKGFSYDGSYQVVLRHPNYLTDTVTIDLEYGQWANLSIPLIPTSGIATFRLNVFDSLSGDPLDDVLFNLDGNTQSYSNNTDPEGKYQALVSQDAYTLSIGKWGYINKFISLDTIQEDDEIIVLLSPGYRDDYLLDLGWKTSPGEPETDWVLGALQQYSEPPFGLIEPGLDAPQSPGNSSYFTGLGVRPAELGDVDSGVLVLTSPVIEPTGWFDPLLTFDFWLNQSPEIGGCDNILTAYTIQDNIRVQVRTITNSDTSWQRQDSVHLRDYIDPTLPYQIEFEVSAECGDEQIVKAGIDGFTILKGNRPTSIDEAQEWGKISVFPNPTSNQVQVTIDSPKNFLLRLSDVAGKRLQDAKVSQQSVLDLSAYPKGTYLLQISDSYGRHIETRKVIKN